MHLLIRARRPCRGTRLSVRPLLAAVLAAFLAVPAAAQVRGRVLDAFDRPVADAVVELWASSQRTAETRTDDDGRFAIPTAQAGPGLMLTVRRMGMQTQTVQLAAGDTAVVVRTRVQPVVLAPVSVAPARARTCPNREDPRARALWERMRSRYWQPESDSVPIFGFFELRSGVGERADAFDPGAGGVVAGWTTGPLIDAEPRWMVLSGYATRANGGAGERTASWSYRALDGGTTQDFTGDHFGAVHTFSLLAQAADRMTIAFCPRERMGRTGQIEGSLVLDADTTLSWAGWRFRTPAPDEDAGGEASFEPPEPGLGRALLARETVFWRKTNPPRYYFESHRFTGWRWRAPGGPDPVPTPR
jgi:hypothetical protein